MADIASVGQTERVTSSLKEFDVDLPHPALPNGDWADGFVVTSQTTVANARAAAEKVLTSFPFYVTALMAVRNAIVSVVGLKTGSKRHPDTDYVGFFPVISQTAEQVVVGMDDRHLDFRCVVDLANSALGVDVSLTTVIDRHNWLGHCYLFVVRPFHRHIIKSSLRRMAD